MINVFHGSDHVIKQPQYLGGKSDNDYGNGFYTTEYEDRARSWATLNGDPDKSIVNVYHLEIDGLKVLDLNDCGVLAWISEVVANRGTNQEAANMVGKRLVELYRSETTEYDIIKGYRADAYQVSMKEEFKSTDLFARREVNKFLSERVKIILVDGFRVPGITAQYAIHNKLIYQKESGGYVDAGL